MHNSHSLTLTQVFQELDSSEAGLSEIQAKHLLEKYGKNQLVQAKKISKLELIIAQFKNPLVYILILALVISLFTGHQTDALIIFIVVLISAIVGYLQEFKANNALSKLSQMIDYKAKVIREGKELVISQSDIVVGDIILLASGDKVLADARIISAQNFEVNESALTGESNAIEKSNTIVDIEAPIVQRNNMVFQGTIVTRGNAQAIVIATGNETELGKIAHLVQDTQEIETPLQIQIHNFGKMIGVGLIIINIAIFALGALTGKGLFEMFMTSVAMVVAAVPEGLLPAMTIILAIGMQRLAKQNGLVRKMLATETLGSVSVICSDKTGTLTQGEMRVSEIITDSKRILHNGKSFSEKMEINGDASHITALKIGLLCNNAIIENPNDALHEWEIIGNPTEKALLLAGRSAGLHKEKLEQSYARIAHLPFESESKYMITGHKTQEGGFVSFIKGAPERVLELMSSVDVEGSLEKLTPNKQEEIKSQCENLAKNGLRVIVLGYRLENKSLSDASYEKNFSDFVYVGLVALKDPLRPEAKETIALCQQAGIHPIIITGDHKLTTMALVADLGLKVGDENVMEGVDLDKISDKELADIVKKIQIFARVEPRHKIRIVTALQKNGEIVAMTGDGINDAPALKKADIGVALGSGTDVAKETADLVLLDNNFKTITRAIELGRATFDNIRKVVLYLLSNSLNEVILIGLSIIMGLPMALLPVQILWIKMIEDSLPSIALAFDPVAKNVMQKSPRSKNEAVLDKKLLSLLIMFFCTSVPMLFLIYYYFWNTTGNIALSQTIAFVGLGISSRFYIFSIRGLTQSILTYNPFQNQAVNWSTVFGFLMIIVAVYLPILNKLLQTTPLDAIHWIILIIYALISMTVYEIAKKIFISRDSNSLA